MKFDKKLPASNAFIMGGYDIIKYSYILPKSPQIVNDS